MYLGLLCIHTSILREAGLLQSTLCLPIVPNSQYPCTQPLHASRALWAGSHCPVSPLSTFSWDLTLCYLPDCQGLFTVPSGILGNYCQACQSSSVLPGFSPVCTHYAGALREEEQQSDNPVVGGPLFPHNPSSAPKPTFQRTKKDQGIPEASPQLTQSLHTHQAFAHMNLSSGTLHPTPNLSSVLSSWRS